MSNFIEKPNDEITSSVMEDLKKRSDIGYKKYGTTLDDNNYQNIVNHAYEEALDLAQYLKKFLKEEKVIQDIVKNTPNDQELGQKIRYIYNYK